MFRAALLAASLILPPVAALAQGSAVKCAADPHFIGCYPVASAPVRSNVLLGSVGDTPRAFTLDSVLNLLLASDVTRALGYTPYNAAANPAGYQTASQVAAAVSAVAPVSGTTAGTFAAGNDSRITGALPAATAAALYQPKGTAITSAPSGVALTGNEMVGFSQGGQDVRIPLSALLAYVKTNASTAAPTAGADFSGVAGLAAWYRFSDSSTVTTSGGMVAQVLDLSGKGFTASRASGARPSYLPGILNGLPVVDFSGGGQALEADSLAASLASSASPYHIFAVVRTTSDLSSLGYASFFSLQKSAPFNEHTDGLYVYAQSCGPSWGTNRGILGDESYVGCSGLSSDNIATPGSWVILETTFDGTQQGAVAVNGGAFSGGTVNPHAGGFVSYAKGRFGLRIAPDGTETRPFPGQIAEMAFVNGRILGGTERTNALKYLNARYNLGITGLQ